MMLPKIILFFLISNCALAFDENTFLYNKERNKFYVSTSLQGHTSNIVSESSASSEETDSDFSIVSQIITGEYFLNDKFSVVASYYFALVLDIDAEIQGFDLGFQYYPLENGSSKKISFMGSQIETAPLFAPYIYVGASTRDYQFSTVSLKFQGTEVQGGFYWHLHDDYFVKTNGFYQIHLNNNVRTLTTLGASIGIGTKF